MENKKQFSKIGLFLFLGSVIIFVVQAIASIIGGAIPAVAENTSVYFLVTMMPMYIIAYPLIFLMFRTIPVQQKAEKKKMRPLHLFVMFLMCYAGMYICNIFANVATTIIGSFSQNEVENVMLTVTGSINPLVNFIVIVICAPIMEELLFRKILIDRTAHFGEGISIVLSGLVFGLFHGNLVQFAYAFFLGVMFGFVYVKTRNIIYTIILHIITNFIGSFIGSLILEWSGYMKFANELAAIPADATDEVYMELIMEYGGGLLVFLCYSALLMLMVLAGIVLFIINFKKFKLNNGTAPVAQGEPEQGEVTAAEMQSASQEIVVIEKGKRFSTMMLNVGMILYTLFWLIMIVRQLIGV